MSTQAVLDRRTSPRTHINSPVDYKPLDAPSYKVGNLVDISQTGILINTDQKFSTNEKIKVVVKPDTETDSPIEITAYVIRTAKPSNDHEYIHKYSYGCLIQSVVIY